MVITLDGPSGTGKSTLAKMLAKKIGFKFLNTGMIYRSICYYLFKNNAMPEDNEKVLNAVSNINIEIKFEGDAQNVIVNGLNCTPYVSSSVVQQYVSVYSQIPEVRAVVLSQQKGFAEKNNIVIEGRDIGTEVFPNAEHKFYVECDISVRAKRRFDDLVKENPNITLEEIEKSLENRDYLDKTRKHSPLVRPKDSVLIDTSNKTIGESLDELMEYISKSL